MRPLHIGFWKQVARLSLAIACFAAPSQAQSVGQQAKVRTDEVQVRGVVLGIDADRLLLQTGRRENLQQLHVPVPCIRGLALQTGRDSQRTRIIRSTFQVVAFGAGAMVLSELGQIEVSARPADLVRAVLLPSLAVGTVIGLLREGEHWQTLEPPATTPAQAEACTGLLQRPVPVPIEPAP